MTLIRTGLLSAIAVGIRMLTALAVNKILAIYVGPAGYAIVGQFQNLVTVLTALASGALATGVTKMTAEHFDRPDLQVRAWQTAGLIGTVGATIVAITIVLLHRPLAGYFLGDENLGNVLVCLAPCLILITLNGLLLSILNGKKQVGVYVMANIAGSAISLLLTGVLSLAFGLQGALVSLAGAQAIVFFVTLALCIRQPWFRLANLAGRIDHAALRELSKFAAMAITAAIVVPLVQIGIRDHLIDQFGHDNGGYWEALMRISGLYLTLVTVPLSIYYLPRLAEIRKASDLRQELVAGYLTIIPITVVGAVCIYLLRDFIIYVLFTAEFRPMADLFAWQMVGDVFKIASWLLGYVMIARGAVVPYMALEIAFGALWYGLVVWCTHQFGVQGAQIAYFITYAGYLLACTVMVSTITRKMDQQEAIGAPMPAEPELGEKRL